jgi:amino acid transporter
MFDLSSFQQLLPYLAAIAPGYITLLIIYWWKFDNLKKFWKLSTFDKFMLSAIVGSLYFIIVSILSSMLQYFQQLPLPEKITVSISIQMILSIVISIIPLFYRLIEVKKKFKRSKK